MLTFDAAGGEDVTGRFYFACTKTWTKKDGTQEDPGQRWFIDPREAARAPDPCRATLRAVVDGRPSGCVPPSVKSCAG